MQVNVWSSTLHCCTELSNHHHSIIMWDGHGASRYIQFVNRQLLIESALHSCCCMYRDIFVSSIAIFLANICMNMDLPSQGFYQSLFEVHLVGAHRGSPCWYWPRFSYGTNSPTVACRKLDPLFFLNSSLNIQCRTVKPSAMCFY